MMDLETKAALYNLEKDPGERKNVMGKDWNSEGPARTLPWAAGETIAELGVALTKQKGSGVREPARIGP